MTRQLWRDGTLRETRLVVNGLPDAPEAALPDEIFVGPPGGQVQIIRRPKHVSADRETWAVNAPPEYTDFEVFDDFAEAFAHALLRVREMVE